MTFFGKNIKKIRTLKKLSQTDFALLFDLNRGNISAYEEGRSEARIDTIIQVANYFSISIDRLLTKDMTINEILNFDIFKNNDSKLQPVISRTNQNLTAIPFLNFNKQQGYLLNNDKKKLPQIVLPGLRSNSMAFELLNHTNINFSTHDIFIGQKTSSEKIRTTKNYLNVYLLCVSTDEFYLGKLEVIEAQKLILNTENEINERIELLVDKIKEFWYIYANFSLNLTRK